LNPWAEFTFLDGFGILGIPSAKLLKKLGVSETGNMPKQFSQLSTNKAYVQHLAAFPWGWFSDRIGKGQPKDSRTVETVKKCKFWFGPGEQKVTIDWCFVELNLAYDFLGGRQDLIG
jgi:hypothetical protein